jgi:hypothetical protein
VIARRSKVSAVTILSALALPLVATAVVVGAARGTPHRNPSDGIVFSGAARDTTAATRIDSGSPRSHPSLDGSTWTADRGFAGGRTYAALPARVAGLADPELYRTQRFGRFTYTVPLPEGSYRVRLRLAETFFDSAGKRVFTVTAQGHPVIRDLDVADEVGPGRADDKEFLIHVTDGRLRLGFVPVVQSPMVEGVEILALADATPTPTPTTVPTAPHSASPIPVTSPTGSPSSARSSVSPTAVPPSASFPPSGVPQPSPSPSSTASAGPPSPAPSPRPSGGGDSPLAVDTTSGSLPPGSYSGRRFTHHISLTAGGSYSFAGDEFDQGLQAGSFGSGPAVHVSLTSVVISNTSGTPGAPDARGLSVLPGAVVTGSNVTVHHTLGDGVGVLGGDLTLNGCRNYDNYGGAPLNADHVDGLQVTSGSATLTNCELGLDPNGVPTRTGNVQCKGDAGTSICNLYDTTIAGYQGRIGLNYEVGGRGGAGGAFGRLVFITAGSAGTPLDIRAGALVQQGTLSIG